MAQSSPPAPRRSLKSSADVAQAAVVLPCSRLPGWRTGLGLSRCPSSLAPRPVTDISAARGGPHWVQSQRRTGHLLLQDPLVSAHWLFILSTWHGHQGLALR